MLNLNVAKMEKIPHLILLGSAFLAVFQPEIITIPRVDTPRPGEIIQGQVTISGQTDMEGFEYSQAFFGYQDNTPDDWFFISRQDSPVRNGQITIWDTTLISDGMYDLKIQVHLEDGSNIETIVENLEVKNYSSASSVQQPGFPGDQANEIPSITPTFKRQTTTPSPINSAEITRERYTRMLVNGALASFAVIILLGLYLGLRRLLRS